jgi:hypothetical protein
MWLNTLMCILGEQFASADNDQITGAVFSVRKAADRMVGKLSSADGEPSYSRLLHWPSFVSVGMPAERNLTNARRGLTHAHTNTPRVYRTTGRFHRHGTGAVDQDSF